MASNPSPFSNAMLPQQILDSSNVGSGATAVSGVGSVGKTMISAITAQVLDVLGHSDAIDHALALAPLEERQDIRRYLKRNSDIAEAIPRIVSMINPLFPGSKARLAKRKDATIKTYNPIVLSFETPASLNITDEEYLRREDQFRDAMWEAFEDRLSSRIQILVL